MKIKSWLVAAGVVACAWACAAADVKISNLPPIASPGGSAVLPIVEGGVTWKVTKDNLLKLYLPLSETNAFSAGITNAARTYADSLTNTVVVMATNEAKAYADSRPASFVGAVSNNVASASLLAVDATRTNGIAATKAHVEAAVGGTLGTNWVDSGTGSTLAGTAYMDSAKITNALDVPTLNVGTINYTNPPTLPSFDVSALPVATAGSMAWCPDAITPWGIGGPVLHNGSEWQLAASKIKASADFYSYMVNSASNTWTGATPYDIATMVGDGAAITSISGFPSLVMNGVGTSGGGTGTAADGAYGRGYFYTSTTTPSGFVDGGNLLSGVGGGVIAAASFSGYLNVGALCDGTDTYAYMYGVFNAYNTTNLPTYGVFLLYDRYKILSTSTATNNWQLATCTNGTYTFTDTGLAVSTTASALPEKLSVFWTTNSATVFTNGIAAATVTQNIPSGTTMLGVGFKGYRTAGSTLRYLRYYYPYVHFRRVSAATGL